MSALGAAVAGVAVVVAVVLGAVVLHLQLAIGDLRARERDAAARSATANRARAPRPSTPTRDCPSSRMVVTNLAIRYGPLVAPVVLLVLALAGRLEQRQAVRSSRCLPASRGGSQQGWPT